MVRYQEGYLKTFSGLLGESYLKSVPSESVTAAVATGQLNITGDYSELKECDVIVVCVPTPLDALHKPDLTHLEDACQAMAKHVAGHLGRPQTFPRSLLERG